MPEIPDAPREPYVVGLLDDDIRARMGKVAQGGISIDYSMVLLDALVDILVQEDDVRDSLAMTYASRVEAIIMQCEAEQARAQILQGVESVNPSILRG